MQGLLLFYPSVTEGTAEAAATDLRDELRKLGIYLPELHDLQWMLCLFQKSLNVNYSRQPPELITKAPQLTREWVRLLGHPRWPELRKMILAAIHIDLFKAFVSKKAVPKKSIKRFDFNAV